MVVRSEIRDRAFVITIDNPPVNVISQAVRAGMLAALEQAAQAVASGQVARVVITGAGRAFVAGADAKEFDGPALEPHLPQVLDALSGLPAVAAINGAALGGGFEIALACRARVLGPLAQVGLPEVTLGVVPGSGGTQRLARLAGLDMALDLIATGRVLHASEAMNLRLADQLSDDPLAAALTLDARLLERTGLDAQPGPALDGDAVEAARAKAARTRRGEIAPGVAIDLVAAACQLPFAQGAARERAAFLDLRQGDQARALRHAFFAERGAGASPALRALPVPAMQSALVAGGGTMGASIAYALVQKGLHVTVLEQDGDALSRARANIARLFDDGVKRGKLTTDDAARQQSERLGFVTGDTPLPPVDIAIEAIFEDLGAKRALFDRLARALPDTTLLATNTSYLDPDAIFAGLPAPGRCLGLHFFAPAHVMKLVEVVRAAQTSDATLAAGFVLAKRLGKVAVQAGICDGFIGNRILTRYRQAADVLLIEGALPQDVDAAAEGFGMAMGPYRAQDLSGLDIAYANRRRKRQAGKVDARPVPIADRMVEVLNRLGRKSGAGWYDYAGGQPTPSDAVAALIREASDLAGQERRARPEKELARRLMLAMIAEGFDILDEGIARQASDIDLVLLHGYGFPRWRGGPMHLAETWGLVPVRDALAALAAEDPLSWTKPPLLERLVASGRTRIAA